MEAQAAAAAAAEALRASAHRRRQGGFPPRRNAVPIRNPPPPPASVEAGGPFLLGRQNDPHMPLLHPAGGVRGNNGYQGGGGAIGGGGGDYDDDPLILVGRYIANANCNTRVILAIITGILLALLLLLASIDSVKPTQWALVENRITGTVYRDYTYENGLHIIGAWNKFIFFPRHQVMVELSSDPLAYAEPLQCRTGRDGMEEATGGQPLSLSVHFMYIIDKEHVGNVHRLFGLEYNDRFTDFSRQAISDVAQRYTPMEFWAKRAEVAKNMGKEVDLWLNKYGNSRLTMFQLTKVGFHPKFERMIVDIQLQVQLYVTNEYRQQLIHVIKEIDVMESEAKASILAINAWAHGNSTIIIANATNVGFNVTTDAKATHYRDFAKTLGLSSKQLVKYVKTMAIGNHHSKHMQMGVVSPVEPRTKSRRTIP